MSFLADGLLIATCLAATVYCYVLGRRLKQFSNTEEGVGQQIVQLSKALEDTRAALRESQAGAKAEAEALAREVTAARKLASQLRSFNEAANTPKPAVAVAVAAKQSDATASPVAEAERQVFEAAEGISIDEEDSEQGNEPEDDDIDTASIDVNAVLAASAGEQQLGFLPDNEQGDTEDNEEDVLDELQGDVEDEHEDEGLEGVDTDAPEILAETATQDQTDNLLKVERMAL